MRINRGGGPVRSGGAQSASRTQGTGKAQGSRFSGMVGQAQGNGTEEANAVQNAMMRELAELAAELEAGRASKEEASRRFVKLVLKRKFGGDGKKRGKGDAAMEESVTEAAEEMLDISNRLERELKRMAKP